MLSSVRRRDLTDLAELAGGLPESQSWWYAVVSGCLLRPVRGRRYAAHNFAGRNDGCSGSRDREH
jgi:hypothetical protein